MAFQKTLLPECPQCKQPGIYVKESRKTNHGTRRRKECECCQFRFTTYEVSADFYKEAEQNLMLVSQFYKLLGGQPLKAEIQESKCPGCKHNIKGKYCAFELPEYNTHESFDCNHHSI